MNKSKVWTVRIITGCVLLYGSCIGILLNAYGVFVNPVCTALALSTGGFTLTRTISGLAKAVMMPTAGRLLESRHFKTVVRAALCVLAVSTLALSLCTQLWQFYILYLIQGLCTAFLDTLTVTIIVHNWFRKNSGLILSLCMCSSGLFSAPLSPVLAALIERWGWQSGYLAVGVFLTLLAGSAVFFLLARDPASVGMTPIGEDTASAAKARKSESLGRDGGTPGFICVSLVTIAGFACTSLSSHVSNYASSLGFTAVAAAGLTSFLMMGNMGTKLVSGVAIDRFGSWKTAILVFAAATVGCLLLSSGIPMGMNAGAVLCGAGYTVIVLLPHLVQSIFPERPFGALVAKFTMIGSLGSSLLNPAIGYSFDLLGTYVPALVLLACLLGSALIGMLLFLRHSKKRQPVAV